MWNKHKDDKGEIKPVGRGSFGPIYDQFKGKPKDAVNFLLKLKDGEAIDALHHESVGHIDLVWGKEGTGHSDGYGLAKLAKYHPEVLGNLQELLDDMHEVTRSDNRVNLESQTHQATVRLTWNNRAKKWLLTAFEKKNSALDNTTDTGETPKGKRNDTATPQNTVSDCEVSENSDTSNGNVENFNNESRENRHSYTVSDITIPGIRGRFYQNEYGSIDLVFPRGDALARIGLPRIPFRITTAIALHILNNHRRELRIRTREDAVAFAVSVMENFDHIRRGTEEGSYIFSIENDRERVGKRAIGIVVETNEGQFLRAKTAGLENLGQLRQREQLWEEGAENSISSTDTASVNVSAMASQQGGEMSGSASNQSASLSDCEVSENSDTSKEINYKN